MPGNTAATRYGNRGGGWIDDQPAPAGADGKPTPPPKNVAVQCIHCHGTIMVPTKSPLTRPGARPVCARIACESRAWSPEQWAGRARMAWARYDGPGDGALDALDREAMAKFPRPAR